MLYYYIEGNNVFEKVWSGSYKDYLNRKYNNVFKNRNDASAHLYDIMDRFEDIKGNLTAEKKPKVIKPNFGTINS